LDGLGRNANTEATYLTVDQQTGAEILSVVQRAGLPLIFINGDCIGGISELRRLYQNGFLAEALSPHDYDLIVLGGGSGGISAAMVN
jgi:thioredoxin reductase (NADPH)